MFAYSIYFVIPNQCFETQTQPQIGAYWLSHLLVGPKPNLDDGVDALPGIGFRMYLGLNAVHRHSSTV